MSRYLVDANSTYKFSFWNNQDFIHQVDLGSDWSDSKIWNYAKSHKMTIITKDADFSNRIILSKPPPRVIHIKTGNMTLSDLYNFLSTHWSDILYLSEHHKLVNVYRDEIYSVE
jgi:predicted nuclease of predicted toxin-antitoxin system